MSAETTTRERLSQAFRRAYKEAGLSQEALSEVIDVKQTTISKYSRGAVQPPLHVLERLEDACGYSRGHVLRLAGFVGERVDTIPTAIRTDPDLTKDEQDALLLTYEIFRRGSATGSGTEVPEREPIWPGGVGRRAREMADAAGSKVRPGAAWLPENQEAPQQEAPDRPA